MARASTSSAPNPYWCTPKRLLAIFRVINLINYLDRGAIASNGVNGSRRMCSDSGARSSGSGNQGDFDPTNFEYRATSSAFMFWKMLQRATNYGGSYRHQIDVKHRWERRFNSERYHGQWQRQ